MSLRVRTTNNITNADGTLENNQIRAQVSKRTLIGATVGVGFRFIDEFNIKVTPEVRYTRWNGLTFGQDSHPLAAQPTRSGNRLHPLDGCWGRLAA